MEYWKALGLAIRDVRKERRFTISDLQFATRINRQAIAKIERGTVVVRLDTLLNICQALDVKPSVLFAMVDNR